MSSTEVAIKKRRNSDAASPSAWRQKRPRKGRLQDLMTMPMDILYEIFTHLLPGDLIRLARLNKDFRGMLMHRSSLSVWISARFNAHEFPDPPEDMSEPAWARLAFDTLCHYCLTHHSKSIDWILRKRICKKCSSRVLTKAPYARTIESSRPLNVTFMVKIGLCLPYRSLKHGGFAYLTSDFNKLSDIVASLDTEEAKDTLLEARKRDLDKRRDYEKMCTEWVERSIKRRNDELDSMRIDRVNAERLKALGWEEELEEFKIQYEPQLSFFNHKLVWQPIRLTEKIWNNIQGPLIELMKRRREYRLSPAPASLMEARKSLVTSVLRTFKYSIRRNDSCEALPGPADLFSFPVVKALLELPAHVRLDTFQAQYVMEVFTILPDLFEEWRRNKADFLKSLLGSSESNLELATSVFICSACARHTNSVLKLPGAVFFPEVLAHQCLTHSYLSRREWTGDSLSVNTALQTAVAELVTCAGLDPEYATVKDMDDLAVYFLCSECTRLLPTRPISVLGWRMAVNHLIRRHLFNYLRLDSPSIPHPEFEYYTPGPAVWQTQSYAEVIELRPQRSYFQAVPEVEKWRCVACEDLETEVPLQHWDDMLDHLVTMHRNMDPRQGHDYYSPFAWDRQSIANDYLLLPPDKANP